MTKPVASPPARFQLKAATAQDHAAIEAGFADLDLTRFDDYRTFIEAHAAAIPPLERAVEACGAAALLSDWPQRRRTSAIADDLALLSGKRCDLEAPLFATSDAGLGALYVLEGSRLGGRVLSGVVEESRDDRVRRATRFLAHGGVELWQSFAAFLNVQLASDAQIAAAISGARTAFNFFAKAQQAVAPERNTVHV